MPEMHEANSASLQTIQNSKIREPANLKGHEMVMLLHGWTSAAAITAQLKDRLIFIRDFQVSGVNTHAEPPFSKNDYADIPEVFQKELPTLIFHVVCCRTAVDPEGLAGSGATQCGDCRTAPQICSYAAQDSLNGALSSNCVLMSKLRISVY